jgi:hypothetical protein
MAEFKFPCPQCGQNIQCDVGYAGTQINCPTCQKPIVVPPAPRAAAVPVPPPAASSRSIRQGTPALAAGHEFSGAPVPAKSRLLRNVLVIAAAVVVLAGLAIGGWYGYSKIKIHKSQPGLVVLGSGDGNGSDSAGGEKMKLTDISFAEGKVGQAFSFNGKSSSIKIPASPALDVGAGDGLTIMAWIKPSDVNGFHPLFQWTGGGGPLNCAICFNSSESGVLMGNIAEDGRNHFVVSNQGVLASGVFQHIALTYDKASGLGTWYLNGVMVAQRQLGSQLAVSTKGDLVISQRNTHQSDWSSNRSFAGLMDEVAIYNRALSAAEIQDICTEQNHGGPLTLPAPSTGWFESWMR